MCYTILVTELSSRVSLEVFLPKLLAFVLSFCNLLPGWAIIMLQNMSSESVVPSPNPVSVTFSINGDDVLYMNPVNLLMLSEKVHCEISLFMRRIICFYFVICSLTAITFRSPDSIPYRGAPYWMTKGPCVPRELLCGLAVI